MGRLKRLRRFLYLVVMNLKTIFACAAVAFVCANAQVTEQELLANPALTASGYSVYPEPDKSVKLTKAPAGYKPFYISHYGRHGSRYHYTGDDYRYLYETLLKADSANALTQVGKKALVSLGVLNDNASPRIGDLTQVGVRQHQGIARRMYKNFPEVFGSKTVKGKKVAPSVDTYASTSGRCLVSMAAFTGEMRTMNPDVNFRYESGKSLMKFICPFNWNDIEYSKASAYTAESDKLWKQIDRTPLVKKLFSDSSYVASNVDVDNFSSKLFETINSLQGMDASLLNLVNKDGNVLDSLFTVEESIARWKAQNAWWYSVLGTSPLIGSTHGVDFGKNTLEHFLVEADRAIAIDTSAAVAEGREAPVAATLRFGHDTGILPLAGLMQLSVASAKVTDLSKLHEQWNDFRIIPMAANLQMVFYKAKGKPILVKFLYNEREVTVPVECPEGTKNCPVAPYYRWDDIREFYSK